ncbi:uncharacterized protein LOC133917910 [Phragmites australis]|uniref:uncharacterized protein LOC133917910 n=1 Tax=Phragmites australis TaxID=29695 RepID=UPI002D792066|nr:uncharacterized protein LOC133917910 [Phragmites australis]
MWCQVTARNNYQAYEVDKALLCSLARQHASAQPPAATRLRPAARSNVPPPSRPTNATLQHRASAWLARSYALPPGRLARSYALPPGRLARLRAALPPDRLARPPTRSPADALPPKPPAGFLARLPTRSPDDALPPEPPAGFLARSPAQPASTPGPRGAAPPPELADKKLEARTNRILEKWFLEKPKAERKKLTAMRGAMPAGPEDPRPSDPRRVRLVLATSTRAGPPNSGLDRAVREPGCGYAATERTRELLMAVVMGAITENGVPLRTIMEWKVSTCCKL